MNCVKFSAIVELV